MLPHFKNKLEFDEYFSSELACAQHFEQQRWNGTPTCPACGSEHYYRFKTRLKHPELEGYKDFQCKACRKKYTVLTGTIFESGKIPLRKWFYALYRMTANKKPISSHELSRDLGITQKTAWFILHRLRTGLEDRTEKKLDGIVEVDETLVGQKERFKHRDKKVPNSQSGAGKTVVMGLLQRDGRIIMEIIPNTREREPMRDVIRRNVKLFANVVTDSHTSYLTLKEEYPNHVLVKGKGEQGYYLNGIYHTNTIEGFWSFMKRVFHGTYHYVSPKHMLRYCGEAAFRYCAIKKTPLERFSLALSQCNERRLKYKVLTKGNQIT